MQSGTDHDFAVSIEKRGLSPFCPISILVRILLERTFDNRTLSQVNANCAYAFGPIYSIRLIN